MLVIKLYFVIFYSRQSDSIKSNVQIFKNQLYYLQLKVMYFIHYFQFNWYVDELKVIHSYELNENLSIDVYELLYKSQVSLILFSLNFMIGLYFILNYQFEYIIVFIVIVLN